MTKVLFKRKTSDEIANLPVEDGALIYNYETGATYLDYDDERIATGGGMPTGDTFPIGAITSYAGSIAPTNWLICDGSAISRTTYADLFNAIGITYGAGNGSTTFNLPDLQGKIPVGKDTTQNEFDTLGETGGEKTHTLTIDEMPSHKHDMKVKQNASSFSDGYPAGGNTYEYSESDYPIQNTGGGQPHNNLQPYITLNYIIKAFQSAGTVANVAITKTLSDTDTYSCNYINSIIETGTNSDGSWIKYNDGTMICYITKEYNNVNIINSWGSVYESDRIQLGNFPQQFINIPTVTASCVRGSSVFLEALSPTNTSIGETWFMRPVSQSNTSPTISFIAIGKWK